MENNQINAMPRIGDPAPAFTAKTTQGMINFPSDYQGKWKILFSHPADFTPVCTSEFMTFASMADDFEALNCQLVGLSVDGLYSHIAWLRTIKDKIEYKGMKDVEVKFPLIEDITMEVAKLYGMIQPGESQTRKTTFARSSTTRFHSAATSTRSNGSLSDCKRRTISVSHCRQTGVPVTK